MNLLIVNDIEITVQFLTTKINWKAMGINIIYNALSADEAREILLTCKIDIILCDIEMPGESGIELIHWVLNQHFPCDNVFLTCHANFDYIHEAMHLEAMDYILYPTTSDNIENAMKKVIQKRQERLKSNTLQEYGRHWVEMHNLNADGNTAKDTVSGDVISSITTYIMQHISCPNLSVNEIAKNYYLSLSYLSRLFKKTMGISINQYIIGQRMELAARLLETGQNSVSNIALEVGYNNYPHFTSTFKKHFGVTPSQYRENFLKQQKVQHLKTS